MYTRKLIPKHQFRSFSSLSREKDPLLGRLLQGDLGGEPSPSPEAPAGQARDAGEGDGGDLRQELLARQLGGELPGRELGSAAGCCPAASLHLLSFNSAPPALDCGDWAGGFPPRPWQGLGPRAAAFGESGVDLATGSVRWVLQDVPLAARAVRWRRVWSVRVSSDLRPDLKMAAAQLTTSPRPWSASVFSGGWWAELVLGVIGGNPWLPAAAGCRRRCGRPTPS
jgi:hypothetical protein